MAKTPNVDRQRSGFLGLSTVGGEQAKRLRVSRIFRLSDTIANVGAMSADNICYVALPVGNYTYRSIQMQLIASAAIASKTTAVQGDHVVNTAAWTDYVEWVALEINGREVMKLRTVELVALNAYHNVDTLDGVVTWLFGHRQMFEEDLVQDAYLFGTGTLFSAKILIKTKAGLPAGMKPRITCEYVPVRRPVGYAMTATVNEYSFAASGKQIITDIPNGIDFAGIWIIPTTATDIKNVLLEVDRQIAFECSAHAMRIAAAQQGKDVAALTGLMLDGFRDGKAIGFDAVTNAENERKRGADVRLTLDLTAAGSFRVITLHCGLFNDQR